METTYNRILEIWNAKASTLQSSKQLGPSLKHITAKLAYFFCPGPFYFYVFDFIKKDFLYVHPNITNVLGIPTDRIRLDEFIDRIHPDDIEHFQKCEALAGYFFFDFLPASKALDYKVIYFYRIQTYKDEYKLMLHQSLGFSLDDNNRIYRAFGVHTDVSNLMDRNNMKISFQCIEKGRSYMGLDIRDVDIDRLAVTNPLSNPPKSLLTKRQVQILQLIAEGYSPKEIAPKLKIKLNTIRTHRQNIRKKMCCKTELKAVVKAMKLGII